MSFCCGRPDSSQLPNDPSNDVGFYALGISGGIRVVMRMPGTNPQAVAYTILYSSAVNHFDASIEIAKVRGEEYYDWYEEPTLRYYWIEQVSINGTHEERLGPVSATSIDPSILAIERISQRIHEGLLATSLRSEINRIDPLATSISNEALQRASEIGSLTQITESIQEIVGDNLASFENRLTVLATDQEAIVENVETLLAEFVGGDGPVTAAIQEAKVVIASETLALAERSTQLEAVFEDDDGNVEWAALQHQLSTSKVDKINNTIENAWMVKLQSQLPGKEPLIGGFGLVNDGLNVEAGFDVDTFWIGRANGAQIYPFIIDEGNIYFNGQVQFSNITGEDKPQAGATRNIFRGNWANASSYEEGDIVNFNGNSWAAQTDHNASTANRPPELWSTISSTWLLNSARGDSSHFRYSANADGSSMTTTPQSNSEYVGFAVASEAPTAHTGYAWSKYVGEKGDKGDKGNTGSTGSAGPQGESVVIIYKNDTGKPSKPSDGPVPSGWATSVNPTWTGNVWRCQGIAPVGSSNYVWGEVDLDFASWRRPNKTTIDGAYIETGTITADQIKANSITGDKIEAGSITADQIEAGTITADKIDTTDLIVDTLNIKENAVTIPISISAPDKFALSAFDLGQAAHIGINPMGGRCAGWIHVLLTNEWPVAQNVLYRVDRVYGGDTTILREGSVLVDTPYPLTLPFSFEASDGQNTVLLRLHAPQSQPGNRPIYAEQRYLYINSTRR